MRMPPFDISWPKEMHIYHVDAPSALLTFGRRASQYHPACKKRCVERAKCSKKMSSVFYYPQGCMREIELTRAGHPSLQRKTRPFFFLMRSFYQFTFVAIWSN